MKKKLLNVVDVDKIRRYMKENKLTQVQFAEMCKISVSTLQKILGKWASFELKSVFKVCKGMGIELHQIFKDEKPTSAQNF